MEKKNKGSKYSKPTNHHLQLNHIQSQPPKYFKPLGGICLYNEHYLRHVQNKQSHLQVKTNLSLAQRTSNNQNATKQCTEYQLQQQTLKETAIHEVAEVLPKNHNISSQIERIISDLRYSQLSTTNLLQELKKNAKNQEYGRFSSFQEIFQLYTQKNIRKFSSIMQKIEQELRRKFSELLKRVKREEEDKLKKQWLKLYVNQSTQTHLHHHTHNLEELQKELQKQLDLKKIEYETLFHHKTQTIMDFNENSIEMEEKVKKQHTFIKNLEIIVKQKNNQLKKLQKQLKSVQDSLFSKIVHRSSLKSELQSIQEDQPKQDVVESRLPMGFKKKFRSNFQKRRAESVIVTKNYSNNKLKEILTSITDLENYESKSMKQIKIINNSQRQKDKSLGNRFSMFDSKEQSRKTSKFKKHQIKIPERYKNKDPLIKNRLSNSLWKPRKMEHFQKRVMRKSQSTVYAQLQKNESKMSSQKSYNHRFTAARPSVQSNTFFQPKNHRTRDIKPRHRYSVQTKNQFRRPLQVNYSKLLEKETKKTHVSIYQNKQSQKNTRILKQVSFHLKNDTSPNFKIYSRQIDILIGNSKSQDSLKLNKQQFISSQIKQPIVLPKQKYQKLKLTKSKLTKKTHFKASSELPSFNKQLNLAAERAYQQIEQQVSFSLQSKENHNDDPSEGEQNYLNAKILKIAHKPPFHEEKNSNQLQKLTENKIKNLAFKCKNKDQFLRQIKKLHRNCSENCEHLRKYLLAFQKLKNQPIRATIKMRVQNLNTHIGFGLPTTKITT